MSGKKVFVIAPDFYGIDKSICRAFESFGFEVILKNTNKRLNIFEKVSFETMKRLSFTKVMLNKVMKFFLEKYNEEYLRLIKENRPDIVFIIKGETVFPRTIKALRQGAAVPCIAYIWDCPFYSFAGQYADDYRKNNFADGMHLYDHVFVYDPYYVEEIRKRGVENVSYLPLATDPDHFKKTRLTESELREFDFDAVFVGSALPNRIEVLDGLNEFKIGAFGEGWDKWNREKKLPSYYRGKAAGDKVLKIYNGSKIVLNIHDPEARHGVNTRTFDIPACGAFEMVDYKPELKNLFNVGEEIVCYKDIDELKKLIRFYLDRPDERERIVDRAKGKVLKDHTWRNRIGDVMEVLRDKGLL